MPFWFANIEDAERFLLITDGASPYKFDTVLPWIKKEKNIKTPVHHLSGVPRTTFATQACDMGILKDFKRYTRRSGYRWRNG